MQRRRLVVLAALAACGDNRAGPRDAAPPPYPDAPPYVDPGPTINFEEGPEPNGYGVSEASGAPAGVIAELQPLELLHGHLVPFRDADSDGKLDPDVDTFMIRTLQPTGLRIDVQGGAFQIEGVIAHDGVVSLATPGTYKLSIANAWPPQLGAPSDAGEYFVSTQQVAVPP